MKRLVYPIIIAEYNDDGHYYVATSPNIPGMVTQGDSFSNAACWSEDAIITMLENEETCPKIQDPRNWPPKSNERVVYISINPDEIKKDRPSLI